MIAVLPFETDFPLIGSLPCEVVLQPEETAALAEKFKPFIESRASLIRLKNNPLFNRRLDEITAALSNILLETIPGICYQLDSFYIQNDPFIYLKNMPIGEIGETPASIRSVKPTLAEFISLAMLGLRGRNLENLLIGNVLLKDDGEIIQDGTGGGHEPFHTHADMADYGVLYCLRGTPNVASMISSTDLIRRHAPPQIFASLATPYHYHGPDKPALAILEPGDKGRVFPFPAFGQIFKGSTNFYQTIASLDYRPCPPEAVKAIKWLLGNIKSFTTGFTYEAGDMIIINQQSTIRGIVMDGINTPQTNNRWLLSTTAKLGGKEVDITPHDNHTAAILGNCPPQETLSTDDCLSLLRCAARITPSASSPQPGPRR